MINPYCMTSRRSIVSPLVIIGVALAAFLPGIDWGLPTRAADRELFGDRVPWTGQEVLDRLESGAQSSAAINATSDSVRGADVDATPILDRSRPVELNDTDQKRAQIVQRYRLMSRQPDEFIQFKALAEMNQRAGLAKFDPRLYQYGGLWIYPVGALIRTAMAVGYIESPPVGVSARAFYLDHPEVFGRFYIIARLYSTMWGVLAALAVAWIARRWTASTIFAILAALLFILLPVTRTAAHEAKPHLAGAALCLWAVVAAMCFVDHGKRRYALFAGALCGAAMAMVISMILSLAVLPMMGFLRFRRSIESSPARHPRRGRAEVAAISIACLAAFVVYALTNPFLIYNAIFHRDILQSNLGNSTAMYGVGGLADAVMSAIRIASKGMTPAGLVLFAVSLVALAIARCTIRRGTRAAVSNEAKQSIESDHRRRFTAVWLLAAPAICVFIQFVLLAAGKPAEYARFGLVLFAAGSVAIAAAASLIRTRFGSIPAAMVVLAIVATGGMVEAFRPNETGKETVSGHLASIRHQLVSSDPPRDALHIGLAFEPAPWSVVPLDLFRDRLILIPKKKEPSDVTCDVFLYPSNLSSQIGLDGAEESVDWKESRTRVRPAANGETSPNNPIAREE